MKNLFVIIFMMLFLLSCSTKSNSINSSNNDSVIKSEISVKRAAPKKVEPIIINNIRYTSTMNEILATETESNNLLWKKEIYEVIYDKNLETDVQDIFIDSISVNQNMMFIRNEKNEVFVLNLKTLQVKKN